MSLNLISKYLFLEQKAQSLEEVLTFLTKAGGSIHIFSESTHIEALIKPCKMMKIKKKSYLYNPIEHYFVYLRVLFLVSLRTLPVMLKCIHFYSRR